MAIEGLEYDFGIERTSSLVLLKPLWDIRPPTFCRVKISNNIVTLKESKCNTYFHNRS